MNVARGRGAALLIKTEQERIWVYIWPLADCSSAGNDVSPLSDPPLQSGLNATKPPRLTFAIT